MKPHIKQIYDHVVKYSDLFQYKIEFSEYLSWWVKRNNLKVTPIPAFDVYSGKIMEEKDIQESFISTFTPASPEKTGLYAQMFQLEPTTLGVFYTRSDDTRVWCDVSFFSNSHLAAVRFQEKYEKYGILKEILPEKKFGFGSSS